jgi:hypothetical protein
MSQTKLLASPFHQNQTKQKNQQQNKTNQNEKTKKNFLLLFSLTIAFS